MGEPIPLNADDRASILQMVRETCLEEVLRGAALAVAAHVVALEPDATRLWVERRKLLLDAAECARLGGL